MFGLGSQELLIILVIAFFIFGGKKLPEIGAGLGKGLKAFKKGLKDIEADDQEAEKKEDMKLESPSDKEKESTKTA